MNCYKDKTFCKFYETCKNGEKCERALTEVIRQRADSASMAVSQFSSNPECYEVKK